MKRSFGIALTLLLMSLLATHTAHAGNANHDMKEVKSYFTPVILLANCSDHPGLYTGACHLFFNLWERLSDFLETYPLRSRALRAALYIMMCSLFVAEKISLYRCALGIFLFRPFITWGVTVFSPQANIMTKDFSLYCTRGQVDVKLYGFTGFSFHSSNCDGLVGFTCAIEAFVWQQ